MNSRRYLETGYNKNEIVAITEEVFGWEENPIYLIALLDGAENYYRNLLCINSTCADEKADKKESEFRLICERLVVTFGGDVLAIKAEAMQNSQTDNGSSFTWPRDAVFGRFSPNDPMTAVCASIEIKERMFRYNVTTNRGLNWQEQIHPRIVIASAIPDLFELLPYLQRDTIYVDSNNWSQIQKCCQRILRASGVKPAPSSQQIENLHGFFEELHHEKLFADVPSS